MRNNNHKIVRKITTRALKANKSRNFFITAAVALTAFMLTTVFSVGTSIVETLRINPFRFEGTLTHMAFPLSDPSQLETLKTLDYVQNFGTMGWVAHAHFPEGTNIGMVFIDENIWQNFTTPTFSQVVGRHGTAPYEVMLSRHKLDLMGFQDPYLGMDIPLQFTLIGDSTPISKTFTLVAMYSEYVSTASNSSPPIFLSPAFAHYHPSPGENPDALGVQILFTNQNRAIEYAQRLAQDLGLSHNWQSHIHPAVLAAAAVNSQSTYLVMGFVIAFLMLTGFLLIYNVMYISVAKDIRFYGLLKTIGTTPRQLRRIVNGQVLWLYIIGLPIGQLFAAALSFVIVPSFFDATHSIVISFSPVIFVGGAVFTLLTAWLGAYTSATKAGKASPIEALRYNPATHHIKVRHTAGGNPRHMAFRNVFRERKRATIVLLSLFLGVSVFTITMTVANSLDSNAYVDALYDHDFTLGTHTMEGFSPQTIGEIAAIPGVATIHQDFLTLGVVAYNPSLARYVHYLSQDRLNNPMLNPIYYPNITQNGLGFMLRGIDTPWFLDWNSQQENPFTPEETAAFIRGEMILVSDRLMRFVYDTSLEDIPYVIPPGSSWEIAIGLDEVDEPITTMVTIGGTVDAFRHPPGHFSFGTPSPDRHTTGTDLFISGEFLQQLLGENLRTPMLHLNVASNTDSSVNHALQALLGSGVNITSRYEARAQVEAARRNLFMLGAGISAILGAISIFNFTNVISVGLLVRKKEFATLESIGMEKKQIRTMIRWEGTYYWGAALFMSATAGNAIALWLFSLLQNSGEPQFATLRYPFWPIIAVYATIIIICSITPEIAYKNTRKHSLVTRLREGE